MTRIDGNWILRTPCCGAFASALQFDSLNFIAREYWTDGRNIDSLAPDDGGLKKCSCGSAFLLSQAESLGIIRKPFKYKNPTWDLKLEAWLRKKRGETTQDAMERLFRVRPKDFVEEPEIPIPQPAKRLDDSELPSVLSSEFSNTELLIVARRRYWQYLNDSYRIQYREYKEINPNSFPAYEPTSVQRENMLRLILMLEADSSSDLVEIAELYRELGEFDKALQVLRAEQSQSRSLLQVILQMVRMKVSGPVRYTFQSH